jgi:phage terminase large subunit-like protein
LGALYKRGKKAAENPEQDPSFGFFCWEADENDDPLDEKTWWKANPNIAEGLMNVDALRNALRDGASVGMGGFMRYHLNIWASVEGDPFMANYHWHNAISETQTEIKPGSRITIGMDASHNNDATAITICDYDTGFIQLYKIWERPIDADEKWFIPRNEVIATVHELFKKYQVVIMYADRKYYTQEIREWRIINGYRVEEYAQDPVTISGAASRFRAGVIDGTVTHGNQEALTRHVMNALDDPRKGYKKATMREKIDALAASVMAVAGRDFFKLHEKAADHWKVKLDNDDEGSFFSR